MRMNSGNVFGRWQREAESNRSPGVESANRTVLTTAAVADAMSSSDLLDKYYSLREHFDPLGGHEHDHESGKDGGQTVADLAAIRGNLTVISAPRGLDFVAADIVTSVDGEIAPEGELDITTISVVAGQTYSISLYGAGATPLPDTLLALFDSTGALIFTDDDGGAGTNSLLTFTAAYTGNYFIGATGFDNGDGSGAGTYTLDVVQQADADEVPDTLEGAVTIATDGITYGFIDSGAGPVAGLGEFDTYRFEVVAGTIYTFELAGGADYNTSFSNVPAGELDTILSIIGPDGLIIASNDDISFPGDISSRISFVAETSGTYYLDVVAYGGQTGGYSITATEQSLSDLDPLDSLNWFSADNIQPNEDNIVYVYFGDSDENFDQTGDDGGPMVTIDWNEYEIGQVMSALEEYENILGFEYRITQNIEEATFRLLKTESEQYGAYFFPQDPAFGASQGVGVFNVLSGGWNIAGQESLQKGGYSYATILHEFGHAHGIAHPHDTGGGSDIMAGVTAPTGSLGVFDLNQGVYTVMSYNDAYPAGPNGPSPFTLAGIGQGWPGTLSPFDIAILQERYGVTNAFAAGNDEYVLEDQNAEGTYYEAIWDTGGTDTIRYSGARDAQIDLLAATIDYTATGGGVVSYVDGVFGGITIANGVTIENAIGGSGSDTILGNAANNVLTGNAGNDVLMGRAGNDILNGGIGNDTLDGGVGADVMTGGLGNDIYVIDSTQDRAVEAANGGTDEIRTSLSSYTLGSTFENLTGSGTADQRLTGNSGNNIVTGAGGNDRVDGGSGNDSVFGGLGNDSVIGGSGDDFVYGGEGNDSLDAGSGNDTLTGDAGDDFLDGGSGNDTINGGSGADRIDAGSGNDVITGGTGNDVMSGGSGSDVFVFGPGSGQDTVTDFRAGDTLDWSAMTTAGITATTSTSGRDTLISFSDGSSILLQNASSSAFRGAWFEDEAPSGSTAMHSSDWLMAA